MTRPQKEQDQDTYRGRFASRIRMLREKSGMDVITFAKKLQEEGVNMNPRSIYHWENAKGIPKIEHFPMIAKVLGLSGPRMLLPKE